MAKTFGDLLELLEDVPDSEQEAFGTLGRPDEVQQEIDNDFELQGVTPGPFAMPEPSEPPEPLFEPPGLGLQSPEQAAAMLGFPPNAPSPSVEPFSAITVPTPRGGMAELPEGFRLRGMANVPPPALPTESFDSLAKKLGEATLDQRIGSAIQRYVRDPAARAARAATLAAVAPFSEVSLDDAINELKGAPSGLTPEELQDYVSPYEEGLKQMDRWGLFGSVGQIGAKVGTGIVSALPEVLLSAIPGIGKFLSIGSMSMTPEGFDPLTAALLTLAPSVSKQSVKLVDELAQKLGISRRTVRRQLAQITATGATTTLFTAPSVIQVAQMEPGPEKDEALRELGASVLELGFFAAHGARKADAPLGKSKVIARLTNRDPGALRPMQARQNGLETPNVSTLTEAEGQRLKELLLKHEASQKDEKAPKLTDEEKAELANIALKTQLDISSAEYQVIEEVADAMNIKVRFSIKNLREGELARPVKDEERSIEINPKEFSKLASNLTHEQMVDFVRSLISEEAIHSVVTPDMVKRWMQNSSSLEAFLSRWGYTGNRRGVGPDGKVVSDADVAHETIRRIIQTLKKITPTELTDAMENGAIKDEAVLGLERLLWNIRKGFPRRSARTNEQLRVIDDVLMAIEKAKINLDLPMDKDIQAFLTQRRKDNQQDAQIESRLAIDPESAMVLTQERTDARRAAAEKNALDAARLAKRMQAEKQEKDADELSADEIKARKLNNAARNKKLKELGDHFSRLKKAADEINALRDKHATLTEQKDKDAASENILKAVESWKKDAMAFADALRNPDVEGIERILQSKTTWNKWLAENAEAIGLTKEQQEHFQKFSKRQPKQAQPQAEPAAAQPQAKPAAAQPQAKPAAAQPQAKPAAAQPKATVPPVIQTKPAKKKAGKTAKKKPAAATVPPVIQPKPQPAKPETAPKKSAAIKPPPEGISGDKTLDELRAERDEALKDVEALRGEVENNPDDESLRREFSDARSRHTKIGFYVKSLEKAGVPSDVPIKELIGEASEQPRKSEADTAAVSEAGKDQPKKVQFTKEQKQVMADVVNDHIAEGGAPRELLNDEGFRAWFRSGEDVAELLDADTLKAVDKALAELDNLPSVPEGKAEPAASKTGRPGAPDKTLQTDAERDALIGDLMSMSGELAEPALDAKGDEVKVIKERIARHIEDAKKLLAGITPDEAAKLDPWIKQVADGTPDSVLNQLREMGKIIKRARGVSEDETDVVQQKLDDEKDQRLSDSNPADGKSLLDQLIRRPAPPAERVNEEKTAPQRRAEAVRQISAAVQSEASMREFMSHPDSLKLLNNYLDLVQDELTPGQMKLVEQAMNGELNLKPEKPPTATEKQIDLQHLADAVAKTVDAQGSAAILQSGLFDQIASKEVWNLLPERTQKALNEGIERGELPLTLENLRQMGVPDEVIKQLTEEAGNGRESGQSPRSIIRRSPREQMRQAVFDPPTKPRTQKVADFIFDSVSLNRNLSTHDAYVAGRAAETIEDLEALRQMSKILKASGVIGQKALAGEMPDKVRDEGLQQLIDNGSINSIVNEAIQAALDVGSAMGAQETKYGPLPEPKLDPRFNAEARKWFIKHSLDMGIPVPEDVMRVELESDRGPLSILRRFSKGDRNEEPLTKKLGSKKLAKLRENIRSKSVESWMQSADRPVINNKLVAAVIEDVILHPDTFQVDRGVGLLITGIKGLQKGEVRNITPSDLDAFVAYSQIAKQMESAIEILRKQAGTIEGGLHWNRELRRARERENKLRYVVQMLLNVNGEEPPASRGLDVANNPAMADWASLNQEWLRLTPSQIERVQKGQMSGFRVLSELVKVTPPTSTGPSKPLPTEVSPTSRWMQMLRLAREKRLGTKKREVLEAARALTELVDKGFGPESDEILEATKKAENAAKRYNNAYKQVRDMDKSKPEPKRKLKPGQLDDLINALLLASKNDALKVLYRGIDPELGRESLATKKNDLTPTDEQAIQRVLELHGEDAARTLEQFFNAVNKVNREINETGGDRPAPTPMDFDRLALDVLQGVADRLPDTVEGRPPSLLDRFRSLGGSPLKIFFKQAAGLMGKDVRELNDDDIAALYNIWVDSSHTFMTFGPGKAVEKLRNLYGLNEHFGNHRISDRVSELRMSKFEQGMKDLLGRKNTPEVQEVKDALQRWKDTNRYRDTVARAVFEKLTRPVGKARKMQQRLELKPEYIVFDPQGNKYPSVIRFNESDWTRAKFGRDNYIRDMLRDGSRVSGGNRNEWRRVLVVKDIQTRELWALGAYESTRPNEVTGEPDLRVRDPDALSTDRTRTRLADSGFWSRYKPIAVVLMDFPSPDMRFKIKNQAAFDAIVKDYDPLLYSRGKEISFENLENAEGLFDGYTLPIGRDGWYNPNPWRNLLTHTEARAIIRLRNFLLRRRMALELSDGDAPLRNHLLINDFLNRLKVVVQHPEVHDKIPGFRAAYRGIQKIARKYDNTHYTADEQFAAVREALMHETPQKMMLWVNGGGPHSINRRAIAGARRRLSSKTRGGFLAGLGNYSSWLSDRLEKYGGVYGADVATIFRNVIDRSREIYADQDVKVAPARDLAGGATRGALGSLPRADLVRSLNWINDFKPVGNTGTFVANGVRAMEDKSFRPNASYRKGVDEVMNAAHEANVEIGQTIAKVVDGYQNDGDFVRHTTKEAMDIYRQASGRDFDEIVDTLTASSGLRRDVVRSALEYLPDAVDQAKNDPVAMNNLRNNYAALFENSPTKVDVGGNEIRILNAFEAWGGWHRIMTSDGYDWWRENNPEFKRKMRAGLRALNPTLRKKTINNYVRDMTVLAMGRGTLSNGEIITGNPSHDMIARVSQDYTRQIPNMITHVKMGRKIYEIMHSNLYSYLDHAAHHAANIRAFREVFPNNDAGRNQLISIMNGLQRTANPRGMQAFDDLVALMQGAPLDEKASFGMLAPNGFFGRTLRSVDRTLVRPMASLALTSQMATQTPETFLGNIQAEFGYRRAAQAARRMRELGPELRRLQAISQVFYDWSWEPLHNVASASRNFSNVVNKVFGANFLNEIQERMAAATAYVVKEAIQAEASGIRGSITAREKVHFRDVFRRLGFNKQEIEQMMNGDERLLLRFVRQTASAYTSGNRTTGEGSRLSHLRTFRMLSRFQDYTMMKTRLLGQVFGSIGKVITDKNMPPAERRDRIRTAVRFLGYTTLQGVMQQYIYALSFYGPAGMNITWHEMKDEPLEFLLGSFIAGVGGPYYWVFDAATNVNSARGVDIGRLSFPLRAVRSVGDAVFGMHEYSGQPLQYRVLEFFGRITPGWRILRMVAGNAGLANVSPADEAAIKALYRWKRDTIGEPDIPGRAAGDDGGFKKFQYAIRRINKAIVDRDEKAYHKAYNEAFGLATQQGKSAKAVAEAIKRRKILRGKGGAKLTPEQMESLRNRIGDEAVDRLERLDSAIEASATGLLLGR
ncbi:MAG TPA: HTH domain-containing protein [Verrucomicrobiota bacterium]|nr:HTH domain-containing protein [Verrucomicrobiota bacterium]